MKNNNFLFAIFLFWNISFLAQNGQIGINTATPQAVLDITAANSGVLIPRLTNPETNVTAPVAGMVIYDTFYKTLRYFDGTNWSTVISSQTLRSANEGVVKLNSGNSVKPSFLFRNSGGVALSVYQNITYSSPLNFASAPTTSWPENITTPTDADFYNTSTGKFLENPIMGQVHMWRVIVNYANKNNGSTAFLTAKVSNPISGFFIEQTVIAPNGVTSGNVVFYLITIADNVSIGAGYILQLKCDTPLDATVDSITRISQERD